MEKIYTNSKLGNAWQKEIRSRRKLMWWFDLNDFDADEKLDGESPIIYGDEAIEEAECWDALLGATCMLLLRNGVKTVVAAVHEKSGGLRFYSKGKAAFNSDGSITEDSPGVSILTVNWKSYAQLGLIKLTKRYLKPGFIAEAVFIDPKIDTLVDWDLSWVMERHLNRLAKKKVRDILTKEAR